MSSCQTDEERDYSDTPFPGELPQPLPPWEVALKIVSCVLVELVAVLGNLVLIAVVARSPRMRSTTNCYIANMAVADLLIALVPMWIHVSTDIISMDKDAWPLGEFLCKFNTFVQVTALVASVLTLMAIAGDRFFAIIFPFKARVTERRVGVVVVGVWLCALCIGCVPLFFYTYQQRQWKDYVETFCTDVWPVVTTGDGDCDQGITSKRAYWTVVTVVLNWLPMVVMSAVYAIIVYRLRFSRLQPAASVTDRGRRSSNAALSAVQRRSKRKVVKMLVVVLVAFMLCTIPFQVTNLYSIYSHEIGNKLPEWHRSVYYAAVFMMYTNSAINPILYGGLNDKFRRGARQLLSCLLCRGDAYPGISAASQLSLSRQPRVSLVEDEARRVKERALCKPSLRRLAISAAHINTALAAKERELTAQPRTPVVTFVDHSQPSMTDLVPSGRHREVTDGVCSSRGSGMIGDDGALTGQTPVAKGEGAFINHCSVISDGALVDQSPVEISAEALTEQKPGAMTGNREEFPQSSSACDDQLGVDCASSINVSSDDCKDVDWAGEVGGDRKEDVEDEQSADSNVSVASSDSRALGDMTSHGLIK